MRDLGDKRLTAELLAGMADMALDAHQLERAARWLGAAAPACEALGVALHSRHGRTLAATRQRLGDGVFAREAGEGRARSLEEVLADALAFVDETGHATPTRTGGNGLTARGSEVLRPLVAGKSNPEIGETLFFSPRTAQTHVTAILAKLGVATRTEAAAHAVRDNLV